MSNKVRNILLGSRLIICVGSGGVGKTTTSAAIAATAAMEGQKVLVLTIDPARRLADAMGLEELGNEPAAVKLQGTEGSLDAMMLDAKQTFDDLIRRTAGNRSRTILDNRIYKILTGYFAGTLEYMALERLYDLYQSGKWELIVLDTPPSQNAKDFFSAPERARQMFDERIMRWFVPDANENAGFFKRNLSPGAVVQRLLTTLGGSDFVRDLTEFFTALSIVRESIHQRGVRVQEILQDKDTHYVVVTSPDPRRVDEAISLHRMLKEMRQKVELFVLNRSHHRFESSDLRALERAAQTAIDTTDDAERGRLIEDAVDHTRRLYHELVGLGDRDRDGMTALYQRVDPTIARVVPALGHDIHEMSELIELGEHVLGGRDLPPSP